MSKRGSYSAFICSVIVLCALMGACAGLIPQPTEADREWVQTELGATSLEDLRTGRSMYVGKCSGCHTLYEPKRFEFRQWEEVLDDMAPRAGMTPFESDLVLKYIYSQRRGFDPMSAERVSASF